MLFRSFKVNARSVADLTALRNLPEVKIDSSMTLSTRGADQVATVTLENPSKQLAFFINLGIMKGKDGYEVAPCYWEENDFSLLPGESREVEALFSAVDLEGKKPTLRVDGWNLIASK